MTKKASRMDLLNFNYSSMTITFFPLGLLFFAFVNASLIGFKEDIIAWKG